MEEGREGSGSNMDVQVVENVERMNECEQG